MKKFSLYRSLPSQLDVLYTALNERSSHLSPNSYF